MSRTLCQEDYIKKIKLCDCLPAHLPVSGGSQLAAGWVPKALIAHHELLAVRGSQCKEYGVWICCGTEYLGLFSNKVEVRWISDEPSKD